MQALSLFAVASAALFASPALAQSFTYTNFTSTAGLNLVERAAAAGPILRVHDNAAPTGGGNRGAVWYQQPVSVASGFETTFVFNINSPTSGGGGDGMAFVIQNEQVAGDLGTIGNMGIGRHASAIGYGRFTGSQPGESIDNSLVFEIDTFNNGNSPAASPIMDPDGNHISIHTGGNGENSQNESFSIGRALSAALGVDVNNGQNQTLRIVYVPGTLEVFLNGALVITTPYSFSSGGTWIDSNSAVGGLDLIGGNAAYVGFTASSGAVLQNHDVVSWTWDSVGGPGLNYCTANVNSSGSAGRMSATGSNSVAANNLTLVASSVAPFQFGIFAVSQTQGFAPNVGAGNLCLGGAIGRYNLPSQILNAGAAGEFALAIDLTITPLPSTVVAIAAGETWNFQGWFRDITTAGQTSNFTDGYSITFVN